MPVAAQPHLDPGRVYRTHDLARWGRNPARLARRLQREGAIRRLARGLFVHPRRSRFGPAPPDDAELLRAFLEGAPFVITGPERWNGLGLGTTALFSSGLVYNTKRSGTFKLGSRPFVLRRVRFPDSPPAEWYVVDLLEHHEMAGASVEELEVRLASALGTGRFDLNRLRALAREYGTRATRALLERAVSAAGRST